VILEIVVPLIVVGIERAGESVDIPFEVTFIPLLLLFPIVIIFVFFSIPLLISFPFSIPTNSGDGF